MQVILTVACNCFESIQYFLYALLYCLASRWGNVKTRCHLIPPQAAEAEEEAGEEGGAEERPDSVEVKGGGQKAANQFNFSERASQTLNNPLRVQ